MFICDQCKCKVEQKISPVSVVGKTRNVEYKNEFDRVDEEGRTTHHIVETTGWEIVKEYKICPECAEPFGIERKAKPSVECRGNMSFEEKPPKPLRIPFVYMSAHNALKRVDHAEAKNKRAKQDCTAAIPLIKGFIDNNKDYAF